MTRRCARPAVLIAAVACTIAVFASAPALRARAATNTTVRIPFSADGAITLEAGVSAPDGSGPFPLAVLSHGDPRDANARRKMHPFTDYGNLRGWLLAHGYAIVIPMRRGFGASGGSYAEGYGSCDRADYAAAGLTSADDIDAALRYMRTQPFVDATRVLLVGHSGGGLGSLAEASRGPDGVVAVVNFAGGRGSSGPDTNCSPQALVEAMAQFGRAVRVPSLWIYAANDHFFGPALARRMFDAFAAGSPQAEFAPAPSSGTDGHKLVHTTAFWPGVVDAFLKKAVPAR